MQYLVVFTLISMSTLCIHCTPLNSIDSMAETPEHYPICVVGAGISGLSVARQLENKGYKNVVIFEKSHKVGGKLDTYREGDDLQVELGAIFHSPFYFSFLEYMREFNLTSVPLDHMDIIGYDAHSAIFHPPSYDLIQMAKVAAAVLGYGFHYTLYERDLEEFGYENASPDLFVSFSDWLDKRNLGVLKPIFTIAITHEGYGNLKDIPAIYILRFVEPELLQDTALMKIGSVKFVKEGLDTLVNRLADTLNVFVNKEVVRIQRGQDHQEIFFRDNKYLTGQLLADNSQKCRNVILAFPPLLSRLNKILDLSENEIDTLKHVKIVRYTTAANYIPTLTRTVYFEGFRQANPSQTPVTVDDPEGTGEVICLLKQSLKRRKHIYSSYSWIRGAYNDTLSDSEQLSINNQLDEFLQKIDKNSKTLCHRGAKEYFPHADTNSLRQGFYKKFGRLQGLGGLYYATPLLTFENIEQSIRGAKALVKKYF